MDSALIEHVDPDRARQRSADALGDRIHSGERATTTIEVASSCLGISRSLGFQLAREGRFPCRVIRAGRRYLVPLASLERLLADSHTEAVTNAPTAQIA